MNTHDLPGAGDGTEPLSAALRRAAQALDAQAPPAALKQALMQELKNARLARPAVPALSALHRAGTATGASSPRRWLRWTAWSGGAAVMAMLAVGSAVLVLVPPTAPIGAARFGSDFLPLAPREDWPDEASPAWLVKSELPQERLAALGLPYDPSRAADRVSAELLVHPSGRVLALRLID